MHRALGRIAELLAESEASIGPDEVLSALDALRREAYRQGYDDAVRALDERDDEAALRDYRLRFEARSPEE
jgi:hypothetical protein